VPAAAAAADGAPHVCLLRFLEWKTYVLHSPFVFTLRNMSSFRTDTSPAPGDQRLSINVEHLLEKKVRYAYTDINQMPYWMILLVSAACTV
jgi:hypothetical protein